jgi:hypothetical protein
MPAGIVQRAMGSPRPPGTARVSRALVASEAGGFPPHYQSSLRKMHLLSERTPNTSEMIIEDGRSPVISIIIVLLISSKFKADFLSRRRWISKNDYDELQKDHKNNHSHACLVKSTQLPQARHLIT